MCEEFPCHEANSSCVDSRRPLAAISEVFISNSFDFRENENDRKPAAGRRQVAPQLDSGHATEIDVEQQAIDVGRRLELEKRLGGAKNLGGKSICAQQTLDALEHAGVVVHDRYRFLPCRHEYPEPGADHGMVKHW